MKPTIGDRFKTILLFVALGCPIASIPFVIFFALVGIFGKGGFSIIFLPVIYSYFFGAIPALVTGILYQWIIHRRSTDALGGNSTIGFGIGIVVGATFLFLINSPLSLGIGLCLAGGMAGAICAFVDRIRRARRIV